MNYDEGQSRLTVGLGVWIPVTDCLPEIGVWVQVFENDNDSPQDAFIGRMMNTLRQRVTPARLLMVDADGYADWYLDYVGGGPVRHVRNVTHWMPLPAPPTQK